MGSEGIVTSLPNEKFKITLDIKFPNPKEFIAFRCAKECLALSMLQIQ